MTDKISIIIPIYNSEPFLKQCLDSIKNQSYKELQIIMVYTTSMDSSLEICKKYAKEDSRFEIVMNEENILRASYARNLGLMYVKGKYVGFVDSDDFIAEDMYEILYNSMKKYNADIAICNRTKIEDGLSNSYVEERILNREETQCEFLAGKLFYGQLWNKLFRWEKVKSLRFDSNLEIAEDVQYVWNAVCLSMKNVYVPALLYFYRCNENSISHNFREKHYRDTMKVFKNIEYSIDKKNQEILDLLFFRKKVVYAQTFIKLKQSNIEKAQLEDELRKEMKKRRYQIRGYRAFPMETKLIGIIIGISPEVGYGLYSIYLLRKNKCRCVK